MGEGGCICTLLLTMMLDLFSCPTYEHEQFFLTTLRTPTKEVAYYIGIQVAVDKKGPGQMPSNPGKFVRII